MAIGWSRNDNQHSHITPIMQQNDNNILIYQDDNGITKVNVRFSDKDVWLTQAQLAEIYDTTQENISMHIKNIYKDAELQEDRTYKDFLLVRQEGKRNVQRNIAHLQNRN